MRLGILVLILIALRIPAVRHALRSTASHNVVPGIAGAVLCALGLGLAV